MTARQIRDSILKWYLVISCGLAVLSLAYDADTIIHSFAIIHSWDWTALVTMVWMPVSLIAIALAIVNQRPLVASLAGLSFVYGCYSIAVVLAWALMDPHHAKNMTHVPFLFIYLDVTFELGLLAGLSVALVRLKRAPKQQPDEQRLVTLDDK